MVLSRDMKDLVTLATALSAFGLIIDAAFACLTILSKLGDSSFELWALITVLLIVVVTFGCILLKDN